MCEGPELHLVWTVWAWDRAWVTPEDFEKVPWGLKQNCPQRPSLVGEPGLLSCQPFPMGTLGWAPSQPPPLPRCCSPTPPPSTRSSCSSGVRARSCVGTGRGAGSPNTPLRALLSQNRGVQKPLKLSGNCSCAAHVPTPGEATRPIQSL